MLRISVLTSTDACSSYNILYARSVKIYFIGMYSWTVVTVLHNIIWPPTTSYFMLLKRAVIIEQLWFVVIIDYCHIFSQCNVYRVCSRIQQTIFYATGGNQNELFPFFCMYITSYTYGSGFSCFVNALMPARCPFFNTDHL